MRKKMQWQWESLDECTQRCAVIGGWLILRLGATDIEKGKSGKVVFRESMTFVPDRDHEWHIVPALKEVEAAKPTVKAADFEPK